MRLAAIAVLFALPALASEAPAPSPWVSLSSSLVDVAVAVLVAALGMLTHYLRAKAAESGAARAGLVATEAARAAVLQLDKTLKPQLAAATADGVLTDEEKAKLKAEAMRLMREQLAPDALKAVVGAFGAAFAETYLAGKIEQAVAEKNALAGPPTP